MTESDINHFAARAKMASISEEVSGNCVDFDQLSASFVGGLVLNCKQRETFSSLQEDFSFHGSSSTPRSAR